MNQQPHPAINLGRVPIGIWPCDPTPPEHDQLPELVERLTPELLWRIVARFAQPGDAFTIATASPASHRGVQDSDITDMAAAGPGTPTSPPLPGQPDHSPHNGTQDTGHAATVGLIVAAIADPATADADSFTQWRRELRPGGVLVVLTICPAGAVIFANNAGLVITAATAAGLLYQQHIVAIHARMANDQLLAPPEHDAGEGIVQQPVHSDLLVFTNPAQDTAKPASPGQTAGGAR